MFGKSKKEEEELQERYEAAQIEVDDEDKKEEDKEKADYIVEKSKLTEKELLAEMIYLLEKLVIDSEQNTGTIEDVYELIDEKL